MGSGPIQPPKSLKCVWCAPFSSLLRPHQKPKKKKNPDLLPSPPLICAPSPEGATDGRLQPSSPPLFADQLRRQPPEATTTFFSSSLTANDPTSQRRRLLLPPRNPRPTPPLLSDFRCPSPPPTISISSLLPEPPSTQPSLFSSFLKTCAQPSSSLISGDSTTTPHHLDLLYSLPPPL